MFFQIRFFGCVINACLVFACTAFIAEICN